MQKRQKLEMVKREDNLTHLNKWDLFKKKREKIVKEYL